MRFYFDIHNGTGLTRDEEGQDLANDAAAREAALAHIRSLLSEEVHNGRLDLSGYVEIRTSAGSPMSVPFADALHIRGQLPPEG